MYIRPHIWKRGKWWHCRVREYYDAIGYGISPRDAYNQWNTRHMRIL